jgi:hypothetical protein
MKTQQHCQNRLIKRRETLILFFTQLVAFTSQTLQATQLDRERSELSLERVAVTVPSLKTANQVIKAFINSFALTGNFSGVAAINKLPQLMKSFGSVTRVSIKRDRWLIC